jgi:hypothetical protein
LNKIYIGTRYKSIDLYLVQEKVQEKKYKQRK